ncbi:MAG: hypothetical protein ABI461_21045, partial [Polyangiaceae bacterium]
RLDSFDDSTGPATPYHPEGDSRADLFAGPSSLDGELLPQSGYRTKRRFDSKVMTALVVAYALGALTASAAFLALK